MFTVSGYRIYKRKGKRNEKKSEKNSGRYVISGNGIVLICMRRFLRRNDQYNCSGLEYNSSSLWDNFDGSLRKLFCGDGYRGKFLCDPYCVFFAYGRV